MAITLEIAGVDRTDWLKVNTLTISRALNGRSNCNALLEDKLRGFVPALGNSFVVKEGATKRFAGNIRSWSKIFHPGTSALQYRLRILDYHHILDKRRVTGDYENMTLRDIVLGIVGNFLDGEGITTTNVATGPTITELVRFNFNTVTEAFNKLSQISGNYGAPFLFYLDFDKDLHFSQFASNPAPFSLTDTSNNWFDMEMETSLDNYRNVQYVRTEYEVAALYSESFVGDGANESFFTNFMLVETPTVTVNGVAKTIGELGVDHIGKDFYWIRDGYGVFNQDHATLSGAQTLAVSYRGPSANVARKALAAEISTRATAEGNSGKYEAVDEQRNINTLGALEAIADGDLEQWGTIPTKITTGIRESGLEPGHRLPINVTKLGINASYLVESMELKWVKAATDFFETRAVCTDVEQFGPRTGFFEKLVEMARIGTGPTGVVEETPAGVRSYYDEYALTAPSTVITSPDTAGIAPGDILTLYISQDATGGRAITWSSDFDPTTPTTINTAAGAVTVLSFAGTAAGTWVRTQGDASDGVAIAAPGDVTAITAEYEYVNALRVRVRLGYTSPGGTFAGVRIWEEPTDQKNLPSTPMDGTQAMDGSTNLSGEWVLIDRGYDSANPVPIEFDASPTPQTHRFYLVSYSAFAENTLFSATEPTPSPNITLLILPVVYQSAVEYAHLVTGVSVTVEYDDTQVASPKYRLRFGWSAPLDTPTVWQKPFGGVQMVYEYEDGRRANGPSLAVNETDKRSDWYDLFAGTKVIRCWFVSYDNSEEPRVNTIAAGVTPSAVATVTWPLATRPTPAKYADNVSSFVVSDARYVVNGQGQKELLIDWVWVRPVGAEALARWGGAAIYLSIPGQAKTIQLTGFELGSSGTLVLGTFPSAAQTWTFLAISQDNNGNPNTDPNDPIADTPTATLSVAPPSDGSTGIEKTALVTSFSASVVYGLDVDGGELYGFTGSWANPSPVTYPEFGGIKLVAKNTGTGNFSTLGYAGPLDTTFRTDLWPLLSASNWLIYAVSMDVNNKENALVAGVTPVSSALAVTAQTTGSLLGGRLVDVSVIEAKLATASVTTAKIANLAVDVTKLANLAVEAAKLADSAVTTTKIANAAVGSAAIANLAVGSAHIADAAIITAKIGDAQIIDAKIASLAANKITGGTISASVTLTSPTLVITTGSITLNVDSSNFFKVTDTGFTQFTQVTATKFRLETTTDSTRYTQLIRDAVDVQYTGGGSRVQLSVAANLGGKAFFYNSSGSEKVKIDAETPSIEIASLSVVGTRKTGWSAWSGTASRASRATSTATLEQVAQAVKALIDDLTTHGLIGA